MAITRTRKIRRSVIAERYGDLFDALYGGADEVHSEVTVTYEDGSTGVIKSDLRILGVDDGVEAKAA